MGLSPRVQQLVQEAAAQVAAYPDAEVYEVPADGDYDHRVVKESLIGAAVCTRKTAQEAAAWLTQVRPPGTHHNRWEPADDVDPAPCQNRPETHRHVVVEC